MRGPISAGLSGREWPPVVGVSSERATRTMPPASLAGLPATAASFRIPSPPLAISARSAAGKRGGLRSGSSACVCPPLHPAKGSGAADGGSRPRQELQRRRPCKAASTLLWSAGASASCAGGASLLAAAVFLEAAALSLWRRGALVPLGQWTAQRR